MTSEQLHDALTLLPGDLIAQTDALRQGPRKPPLLWKRAAAMAASLVLVLGCAYAVSASGLLSFSGGSMEKLEAMEEKSDSAAACAPETAADTVLSQKAPSEEVLSPAAGEIPADLSCVEAFYTPLKPDISLCFAENQAALFRSPDALEEYWADAGAYCSLATLDPIREAFDEAWFSEHDLLLIRAGTEYSEWVPGILSISLTDKSLCQITLCYAVAEEDNRPDPACWHILLPVEKDLIPEDALVEILP